MCGIAGYIRPEGRTADGTILRRMTQALSHRGPDDEGYYISGRVAMGHRRLRIIDLTTGQQPMANEAGTVRVIFNGEIYNFQELRRSLEARGYRFHTSSDTEVIVHAWEAEGPRAVQEFNGMFAFAIWDADRQSLFLCRDRMGKKPLYWALRNGDLIFGSEVKALLHHPLIARELDPVSLVRYLTYEYVPSPHTIFRGIQKLPPGHALTFHEGQVRVSPYWDIRFGLHHPVGEQEWGPLLFDTFKESVRRRLISDVPLGVFLSGGIDSSAVVAVMAECTSGPIRTFSVGFEEESYNELPHAKRVAQLFGTDHNELVFTQDQAFQVIPEAGQILDEPLADASFLPTYLLSRFARRSVTVVLGGEGGDELFCGYPTFLSHHPAEVYRRLPGFLRRGIERLIQALPVSPNYGSVDFLLRQFVRGAALPPPVRTQILLGGFTPEEQARLLSREIRAQAEGVDPYGDIERVLSACDAHDPLDRLIYQHAKFYLADQVLVKVDRASMACGLEVRAPFLDYMMVEAACSIPASRKVRGLTTKAILKEALAGRLPPDILHRRKQGFGIPLARWLRQDLKDWVSKVLHPEKLRRGGIFNPAAVERLLEEHLRGIRDHRKPLWTLLVFELWREQYLG